MSTVDKSILFLHVPHTGGRVLKRALMRIGSDVISVHNDKDMVMLNKEEYQLYFILRPTVDRVIAQCLHYSRNLRTIGIVNYLRKSTLPKNYDIDNPFDFIGLEKNRNLYCKFLLRYEDFDKPVTQEDYECVLGLFNNQGRLKPKWDVYKFPNELGTLEGMIGSNVECQSFNQTCDEGWGNNESFVSEIKSLNKFDIKLYNFLTNF